MKRVILMVLDSLGVGEMPDARHYGDRGTNTFLHAAEATPGFNLINLRKLGLGNIIDGDDGDFSDTKPWSCYGKMAELSKGKDTTTGHWEIAGIETKIPFKTYPEGFPESFIGAFERAIGIKCLGNYPASGTEIIETLGPEHERTGKPIVYTSADSVFQIAANIEVIPLERLYEMCEIARKLLQGPWSCGRVIARPYIRKDGKRIRTADRRDYSVSPPEETLLDKLTKAGKTVYAVGKISDIFNGQGITTSVHTENNMDGVDKTLEAMRQDFEGLIFTNLVDFDSKFGHRRDPIGYGRAIMEFDMRVPELLEALREDDILILCADHGNDPEHKGWDHTREYVPLIITGDKIKHDRQLKTRKTFADVGATIADYLGCEPTNIGQSILKEILK